MDGDLTHDFDLISVEQQPDDSEDDNTTEDDYNDDYSLAETTKDGCDRKN